MLSEKELKLIESYYDGSLSGEELSSMEKKLMNDSDLKRAYEAQHQLVHALKVHERENLKNQIKDRLSSRPKTFKRDKKPMYYYMAAAVTVLLVAVIGFQTWNTPSKSYQEIAEAYFEPYPIKPGARSADDLSEGLLLYQNELFANALPLVTPLGDLNDPDNEFNLVIASAYMAIGEGRQAIPWAQATAASNDELLNNHATWYLALAYLASDVNRSTALLTQISAVAGPYQKNAKKLLMDLDQ